MDIPMWRSFIPALGVVFLLGGGLAGCSASDSTTSSETAQQSAQASADQADAGVLAGKLCGFLSPADRHDAVGMDLPFMTGATSAGMRGASAHDACLYTEDNTGVGAAIDIETNTFGGEALSQLAKQRAGDQDQVAGLPGITLRDAAVAEGGYELDAAAGQRTEDMWFVKGGRLVKVEVIRGRAGKALAVARLVAGKL